LVGLLESARDEIAAGFLGRIAYLAHAQLFHSVIEQAIELLRLDHLTPAAVLGRIVIERWIRDEAERNGIHEHATAKASVLNDRLKGVGKLSVPKWRLIQGYLDVGNAAAHGRIDDFTRQNVEQLLSFAQATCI
jgi:hypothetical protein